MRSVRLPEEDTAWLSSASAAHAIPEAALLRLALRRFRKDWDGFVRCPDFNFQREGGE